MGSKDDTGQPLWCLSCLLVHRLSAGELEKLVYIMQHVDKRQPACLLHYLAWAEDNEQVGMAILSRRETVKRAKDRAERNSWTMRAV